MGVGYGIGVTTGCKVGRGVMRRTAGVGVGRLGLGAVVSTIPRIMLKITIRPMIPMMIR